MQQRYESGNPFRQSLFIAVFVGVGHLALVVLILPILNDDLEYLAFV